MARNYNSGINVLQKYRNGTESQKAGILALLLFGVTIGLVISPVGEMLPLKLLTFIGAIHIGAFGRFVYLLTEDALIEIERMRESKRIGGRPVIGAPPQRDAFAKALDEARAQGKFMIDRYLVGFDINDGAPLWVTDDEMCTHGCVFAKTGVGKTLWLESIVLQQMARGRASGCTFIDAKRDSGTLAHFIFMALLTGRIEDLIVIDPLNPVHSYNFVLTNQRADVKARKVLRAGLPPTSDANTAKHYDRLASDSVYRLVRAFESTGKSWSIRDVAVAMSAFNVAYPELRTMLDEMGARQALIELGHLATSYRGPNGLIDTQRITDNLRGIASELHSISGGVPGQIFCTPHSDLKLTEAILHGKIIYFCLPRIEEAEAATRMARILREDLEISIGEITSSSVFKLEDPHLIVIDEGSSTFGPTWANLFELARKGRFSLLFGAQSIGGLRDHSLGLSDAFYDRVMANVNLKVMMRVGDNATAKELSEWVGKVKTTKTTVGTSVSHGRSSNMFFGVVDFAARRMKSISHSINVSEDETDFVSAEDLKHGMSGEKGLAWFDLGNGKIVQGKVLWFDADIPADWDGREHLVQFQRTENDELGLADWVNEQVLEAERQAEERFSARKKELEKNRDGVEYPSQSYENHVTKTANPEASIKKSDANDTRQQTKNFKLSPTNHSRFKNAKYFLSEQKQASNPSSTGKPNKQHNQAPITRASTKRKK